MDETERVILNAIQKLPIIAQPFKETSRQLGISEDELLERISKLKENGVIRRIGAVINPSSLGMASTLVAASVPEERIDDVAEIINTYEGVTHNYKRNDELNLWFTITERSQKELDERLKEIEGKIGYRLIRLPVRRRFKIGVSFDV